MVALDTSVGLSQLDPGRPAVAHDAAPTRGGLSDLDRIDPGGRTNATNPSRQRILRPALVDCYPRRTEVDVINAALKAEQKQNDEGECCTDEEHAARRRKQMPIGANLQLVAARLEQSFAKDGPHSSREVGVEF